MPTQIDLTGKRALVTGGTRGIGSAAADALAEAGAEVVVAARSAAARPRHRTIAADLATGDGVDAVAAKIGAVDILVSNVGGQIRRDGALAFSDDDWQRELDVNLLSAVRLDRAFVPGMLERGAGSVIHVGSGAARIARGPSVAYSAAKAALTAYSKALATDVGPSGVRVNVVVPGFVPTSRLAEIAAERGADEATVAADIAAELEIPLGRPARVNEVAGVIAFLASPLSSYVTGTQLVVDGGAIPTV